MTGREGVCNTPPLFFFKKKEMNGTPPLVLAAALHAVIVCIAIWDIYAAASGNMEASVSSIVRTWSVQFPVLPLLIGVVLGHLFWSFK